MISEVITYKNKFKCINNDDLVIWGDYNSAKTQQLAIQFKMCRSTEPGVCESEEDIKEWLKGKFIVLLYNQIGF